MTKFLDFVVAKAVPILALVVSSVAMAISGMTYYESTIDAVKQAKIDYSIRSVAYRTIIAWEQVDLIAHAQARHFDVDPYVFPSIKENTRLLLVAMESAVEAGGLDKLLGPDGNGLDMYISFIQALQQQESLNLDGTVPLSEWTKQHVLFGLIRQLDNLMDYPNVGISKSLNKRLREEIERLRNKSHTYIDAGSN